MTKWKPSGRDATIAQKFLHSNNNKLNHRVNCHVVVSFILSCWTFLILSFIVNPALRMCSTSSSESLTVHGNVSSLPFHGVKY